MCDFCEKYANVSGKHGTIRLGAENYMQRIDGRWDS